MIKRWSIFNESSDNDKEIIKNKFIEVREIFLDFEDMDIITSYSIIDFLSNMSISFNPKRDDVDVFIDTRLNLLLSRIPPGGSIWEIQKTPHGGGGNATRIKSLKKQKIYIIVDIKLPGEENEFGSTVIGNESIKLFDDILTANSRLIDSGYDVKMDLNGNHHQYKPVKFLIYF